MRSYLFICVNYNSYDHATHLLRSIESAISCANLRLQVALIDNSTDRRRRFVLEEFLNSTTINVRMIDSENVGYFPGATLAASALSIEWESYDFVSVSNVDVTVSEDFFTSLTSLHIAPDVGVLAPSIISEKRSDDLNPKILTRPTRGSLERTARIFNSIPLFYFYRILSEIKSRLRARSQTARPAAMYAPHGSFIIFTKNYFVNGGHLNYPRFLFGEEIFVGEMCRSLSLLVQFNPSLKILDIDHGSTSLKSLRFLANEHVKSLRYLLHTYF